MKNYRLEVYPFGGKAGKYYAYRLVARSGQIMLYSGTQRFDKSRALRAARRFNKGFGGGELEIRILDWGGNVLRKTR